jgi:hypothetical protein
MNTSENMINQRSIVFGLECLEGKIDFVQEVSPERYWMLEQHSLNEVKRAKAYFIWEWWDGPIRGPRAEYDHACKALRNLLANPTRNLSKNV